MSHAVHTFHYRGENIVFDGLTNSLFTVDNLGKEIIQLYTSHTLDEIIPKLNHQYTKEEITDTYQEIRDLVKEEVIFQDEDRFLSELNTLSLPLSGMCLHISHDCNLRCQYCFADTGPYGQERVMMPFDTAKRAIDLLLHESKQGNILDVDFFGGEPLLNFNVIRQVVQYARSKEDEFGKKINFSVTTNGTVLNQEILTFLNEQRINLIISLDGRPEVHDRMRPLQGGSGSYAKIESNLKQIQATRNKLFSKRYGRGTYTYIRGTFTNENLDFSKDVVHLHDMGFDHIAMEPVIGQFDNQWTIRNEDVDTLLEQYDRLVDIILEKKTQNQPLDFHHFEIDLLDGPCFGKRATGCGAGVQYISVTPEGDLYPCHQFVGNESFKLGTVWSNIQQTDIQLAFKNANAGQKMKCRTCFARYLCSGGCHANHFKLNRDILQPDDISCRLIRKRIECALYLLTQDKVD